MPIPAPVHQLLSAAPAVAFSGSRSLSPVSSSAVRSISHLVPGSALVLTGCAPGTDALARTLFPAAQVFHASQYGYTRGSFAARSIACVKALCNLHGIWLSFPGAPCPAGLAPSSSPSAAFSGLGSGTWASLALAAGLGCPCVVFCPAGVTVPASWGFSQAGASQGGSWWLLSAPAPGCTLSLF